MPEKMLPNDMARRVPARETVEYGMASLRSLFFVISIAVLLSPAGVVGAPHRGEVFSLVQPDGSRVDVKVYGDEFYQRVESVDGFTLIRDRESMWICYAEVSADGEDFISTGVIYRGLSVEDSPDAKKKDRIRKLGKRKKLKRGAVIRKAELRKAELFADGEEVAGIEGFAAAQAAPLTGSLLGLTILIQFPDLSGTISQAEVERFCNEVGYTGYGNNGSVRDYYYYVSNENLEYTNYVTQYYTAQNAKSYYDDCESGKTRELLGEALNWLDEDDFDFTMLDRDSSNRILALNVFYAGSPDCGWAKGLWPHKSSYTGFTSKTGVKSRNYQITNMGSQLRLGTFCHENGHMICGWPDLYDYGGESRGVGGYCIMASSGGRNPRPPNPYFRDLKGWETIIEITNDAPGTLRYHQANSFTTYRYSHPLDPEEFFLVESRLKTGRHEGIPDEGLLIWHIDEDGSNNNEQMTAQKHYRVSVEQADGQFHLERDINGGGSGDLFHASHNETFDDNTLPDAHWWSGVESGMGITNISAVSEQMSFVVDNVAINLMVTPGSGLAVNGLTGGPFGPSSASYTLTNLSTSPVEWGASKTAAWLSVPSGGTISAGESTSADFSLTSAALSLGPGTYTDTIMITDLTNSVILEREVELVIKSRELTAHWKLDETSGTQVNDATGHRNTGEVEGDTSFDAASRAGIFGRSLDLDGTDDTVFFEGFTLPKPFFTISLWLNPDADLSSSSSRDDLLYWDDGDAPHISFDKKNRGEIGLYVEHEDADYEDIITTTRTWAGSTWHHIAFTFDGTDYGVYVNGYLQQTYRHPGINQDTADPYFGSRKSDNNFFDGQLDDIRLLSSEGVYALYLGGQAENPRPADRAAGVRPYTALHWLGGASAVSHDVYVGTDSASVANATTASAQYKGRQGADLFRGTPLAENSEYFWRIDEVTSSGHVIGGEVWSFTTGSDGDYEEIYEAEDALLSGPEVASSHTGYTGTGYADYMNASDDYIEWAIFAHYSGSHDIEFRYALGSGDRPLSIRVNGEVVSASLSFPATGSYDDWTYTDALTVTLEAGLNTLRATATGSKGANIDHVKVVDDFVYTPPQTGLQVCLKLDELSGTTASDSSGGGRDGTLHSGGRWHAAGGRFGGALQFDGADDYIELSEYKGVTGTGSRTAAAWVKTSNLAYFDIVSWGTESTGQRWSLITEPARQAFGVYVSYGSLFGVTDVSDNKWHHVAAVLDSAGSPDIRDVRLYVDGRAEALGTMIPRSINTARGDNVKIGTFDDGLERHFEGLIDEVVIFDVALSDEQIARLCQVGVQSFLGPCGRVVKDAGYSLEGDVNKDCRVDVLDFVLLAGSWLESGYPSLGDISKDESVNWRDVSLLSGNWLELAEGYGRPDAASYPNPPDGSVGVRNDPTLSWQAGDGAESHDVYFGTSSPPPLVGSQSEATFTPGSLYFSRMYYWRIDEVNSFGKTPGPIWKFATKPAGGR